MNRQKEWVKTALRLPPLLHAAIHEEAKRTQRSFNGQIVTVLEKALIKDVAAEQVAA